MTPATVLTIIGIVNGLLTAAKEAPTVVEEARSLIDKVRPHVDACGDEVKSAFATVVAKASHP